MSTVYYATETRQCPNHPRLDYEGYENGFEFCPECGTKMVVKITQGSYQRKHIKIPTQQEFRKALLASMTPVSDFLNSSSEQWRVTFNKT